MFKTFLALSVLLVGATASADAKPVPESQNNQYQKVLLAAVEKVVFACDHPKVTPERAKYVLTTNIGSYHVGIRKFFVDKPKGLVIMETGLEGTSEKLVHTFRTDSSHRNLTEVSQVHYKMEAVDDGTILDPNIKLEWVKKITVVCKASPAT